MRTLVILTGLLLVASASRAGEAEGTWEGYLYRDTGGRVCVGWPVVAMGVMVQPAHVVAGEPVKRLEPLVSSVGDQWYFWNYSLERAGKAAEAGAPRVLVRIRGKVEGRAAELFSDGKPSTMTEARLIAAEFVQPEWLRAWARIFKDKRSPFRIDMDRGPVTPAETKAFAPEALAILLAMKSAPGPTAKQRAIVKAIDAEARVVERFRTRTEWNIQRWLEDAVEKHGLELPGLSKLGALPPGTVEIQRWFLEAKDKAGFLAKVRERWKGEPALLTLAYYVTRGSTTSYATVDLEEIGKRWTEKKFQQRQVDTRGILGR